MNLKVPENYIEQKEFVSFSENDRVKNDLFEIMRLKRAIHSLGLSGVPIFNYLPETGLPPMHARMLCVGFPIEKTLDARGNEYLLQYIHVIVLSGYKSLNSENFTIQVIPNIFNTLNLEELNAEDYILGYLTDLIRSHPLGEISERMILKEMAKLDIKGVEEFIKERLKFRRFNPSSTKNILEVSRPLFEPGMFSHILISLRMESIRMNNSLLEFYVDNDPKKPLVKSRF